MSTPELWVVVPAYNEAATIGATLDALAAQSDRDLVLVVVDNDSTDGTGDVVRRFAATAPFPVRVVVEASARGAGVAADTGFRHAIAHGALLLARTDADCLPARDWVATARAVLRGGAELACGRSVPRRDENPSLAQRYALPAAIRLAALYGRYRRAHRDPRFRAPYVLCHGHNIAITADLYVRCGGTARVPLSGLPEDVTLLNRAREYSDRVVRAESMVVRASQRRLRAWGARRTLLWHWDRRYCPPDDADVHIRTVSRAAAMSRARRRDRRVYLASHPVLFTLLAATRRRPVLRLGRVVLVHGTAAFHAALTRLPLDRLAEGSTGAVARRYMPGGLLFDQEGTAHRGARRSAAGDLNAAGIARLRPVWTDVLDRGLAPLARGGTVDVVELAADLAGATTCAMLDLAADPRLVAQASRAAASAVARSHLPGPRRPGTARAAERATARLAALLDSGVGTGGPGLAAVVAVAAVNTTVAGMPRAVAWCADGLLWTDAGNSGTRRALVDELLRVLAPTPVLPRVAGDDGTVGGCPVRRGDRLLLVARHAAGAHRDDPDSACPAPPSVAQLVFGAGSHACPGAGLARAQLADALQALAPFRPVVVRARADRRSALPGWRSLVIKAGEPW